MINWKQKGPIELANRMVACDMIREVGAVNISKIKDERLANEFLVEYENEEGKSFFEIDWKFVLFGATEHQIGKLLDMFKPKKSNLVDKDGKQI
jgi:hypothetical protein